ncbi:4-hydroxybutyrate CoA-transferase [Knoellia sinensis KCTC 19936]|uniref:4-hydroxybutyrate CoA-transferase n=1 Tax=Knoellia sinensis KCTC 19936 TaxID=1385520 RepID=A0A0A0JCC0_9MICO|nr:acetyl-CoA hydrolase/transferase C-terminal domain-containing protein [Knoellia sinensis]KGN33291.1 4-hydroxybutyrate CoA-transferase [Knoellia sinensis KCTC 19936]
MTPPSSPHRVAAALREHARRLERPLRVVAGGNAGVPWDLLRILEGTVEDCELFMLNAPRGVPIRPGITHVSPFVGAGVRGLPELSYIPSRLSHVPALLAGRFVPDVVLVAVAPLRSGQPVSLGAEVNILPAAMESCRATGGLVLAESRTDIPYTHGDAEVDRETIDLVIESLARPAATHSASPSSAEVALIGSHVAARIASGATLQLGIGLIPDAVVPRLTGKRRLGVWSEMVSDGVLHLDDAGALDPERPITASFAVGSPRLNAWLNDNPRVQMRRTEVVNDPGRIAAHPAMTSINTALAVDLYDQANATHVGSRLHSGFGGQCDFVSGAMDSAGGQAIMALRSWHPRADVSSIVALLEGPVTSFQHTAVITEQGTAEMLGWDAEAQARHLIEVAHPSVRDDLWEEAEALGLIAGANSASARIEGRQPHARV